MEPRHAVSGLILCVKAAQLHELLLCLLLKLVGVGVGIFADVMEYISPLCKEKRYLLTPL